MMNYFPFAIVKMASLITVSGLLNARLCAKAQPTNDPSAWTIYIANDNCPDYTWGYSEEQTRQSFADIVRAHLDEMKRTDDQPDENRDRYNMAVTQEALCFLERYPDRRPELIRRLKEGRIFMSLFLCNSLWGFQSVEGAIRTLYPARRLEREWGIALDVAEHIEEPSLPWGMVTVLAGCGVRWLSNPFYAYDSTFGGLKNPPLFIYEGPEGSQIRVVMDAWASQRSHYTQGAHLLNNPQTITNDWLPHYQRLGAAYPVRAILASGTHGDISPHSGDQARGFAQKIINYNSAGGPHPTLVNATLPQFCRVIDEVQAKSPFLPRMRGCFGHSWDTWPVSLARYAASLREGERAFLAAETLLAMATLDDAKLAEATRADRERAEWCWAMLSDHAWNGTDQKNKRHNADLRRRWSEELIQSSHRLQQSSWTSLGLKEADSCITLFNSLSLPRAELVRIPAAEGTMTLLHQGRELSSQVITEDGERLLCFVSPVAPGFSFMELGFRKTIPQEGARPANEGRIQPADSTAMPEHVPHKSLRAAPNEMESPYYYLTVDPKTGGVNSLIHKATGAELVSPQGGRMLCQTVYFNGQEHVMTNVTIVPIALGPVLARLQITGAMAGMRITNLVTVYAELDRVDFDVRIQKPALTKQERLCHLFPVAKSHQELRIETPGAVIRPRAQPEGDLLPGADTRRFAVQGFVAVSSRQATAPPSPGAQTPASTASQSPGIVIAPLDAFLLRLDLAPLTFEALGNDQNYHEVTLDQNLETQFRFRYAIRAATPGYNNAESFAWSRSVATPLLARRGALSSRLQARTVISIDPTRAIATCLKPSDAQPSSDVVVRLWETAGLSGPLLLAAPGFRRALHTDLLERDLQELPIKDGRVEIALRSHGFAGLRLVR
jgi:hypothetical protein